MQQLFLLLRRHLVVSYFHDLFRGKSQALCLSVRLSNTGMELLLQPCDDINALLWGFASFRNAIAFRSALR